MAEFQKLIPFIFHFAAGVYGREGTDLLLPPEEQFEIASRKGWSNDPDDPGGATMIDVTLGAYRTYRKRCGKPMPDESALRNITFREWSDILKEMYWDLWLADEIESQGVANILVDWVWASGAGSIRKAQRILGVRSDGKVGPVTLKAINSSDPEKLFFRIRDAREHHYRGCRGAWKYLNGWLRRLSALQPDGRFRINGRVY